MKVLWSLGVAATLLAVGVASGCGHASPVTTTPDASTQTFDTNALHDPLTCGQCHPNHLSEWAGSMHAYASQDPVFLAMNARMHRENPSLGSFCVKCHAPMALALGMTTDGTNLPQLAAQCAGGASADASTLSAGCGVLGITCYFCHNISSVDSANPFNAAVTVANDAVMRGELRNPALNSAHASAYAATHDVSTLQSATMCGACHDIRSPAGGEIERTFMQWHTSAFSGENDAAAPGPPTGCGASGCHMVEDPQESAIALGSTLDGGAPPTNRHFRHHDFPAVDQTVTPFANPQTAATEKSRILTNLQNGLQVALCVGTHAEQAPVPGVISVAIDTVNLGHDFPSGAAQDRRLWAEVIAKDGSGNVLYQSGVVPDGTSPVDVGKTDTDMWLLRDCMFGTDGGPVDMFWQGATTDPNEIPALQAFVPNQRAFFSHKIRTFPKNGAPIAVDDAGTPEEPATVSLRLRLQPIGIDVLDNLVDSGDLDASFVSGLPPPIDIPLDSTGDATLTWTAAAAAAQVPSITPFNGNVCVGTLIGAGSSTPALVHTNPLCTP